MKRYSDVQCLFELECQGHTSKQAQRVEDIAERFSLDSLQFADTCTTSVNVFGPFLIPVIKTQHKNAMKSNWICPVFKTEVQVG